MEGAEGVRVALLFLLLLPMFECLGIVSTAYMWTGFWPKYCHGSH